MPVLPLPKALLRVDDNQGGVGHFRTSWLVDRPTTGGSLLACYSGNGGNQNSNMAAPAQAARSRQYPSSQRTIGILFTDFRNASLVSRPIHGYPSKVPEHRNIEKQRRHRAAMRRRHMQRREVLAGIGGAAALLAGFPSILRAQEKAATLNGAVQFNDEHAFNRALLKFEELVKQYYGKPITFILHRNSSLGLEKQYFEYMAQGKAVDYGIVSPAHMSTFSKAAPFIDAPFLFRDLDHWNKVLDADILKPVADEIAQKAEVMLIGYAGGGTRNIFINKPMASLEDIKGLKVRVQGAPIWSKTFQAAGMAPTVIAYNEVYNAIQNNVISAGENEAAGVESMKFYEVAPNLAMTQHAITIPPICFSAKTFKSLS